MKEFDSIIDNLNAVINKSDGYYRYEVDSLIGFAELYKKQFNETIERLSDSSNELIKKIIGVSTAERIE